MMLSSFIHFNRSRGVLRTSIGVVPSSSHVTAHPNCLYESRVQRFPTRHCRLLDFVARAEATIVVARHSEDERQYRRVSVMPAPLLFTVDEAASLLRTSRRAIYVMVERRQLPGVVRIGRRLLFRSSDLLDWLNQKRAPSPEE